MGPADLSRLLAVVPVRSLSGAKSRLGEPLDPEERADLIMAMLRQTLAAALASRSVRTVALVSKDPEVLEVAHEMGVVPVLQRSDGLNEAITEARSFVGAGVSAILVLPADLAFVGPEAIDKFVATAAAALSADAAQATARPLVALVPDRHGTGTNALLVSPLEAIRFQFGVGSRAAHQAEAARAGALYVEAGGVLTFDVDTPEDLLEADRAGLGHGGGR